MDNGSSGIQMGSFGNFYFVRKILNHGWTLMNTDMEMTEIRFDTTEWRSVKPGTIWHDLARFSNAERGKRES